MQDQDKGVKDYQGDGDLVFPWALNRGPCAVLPMLLEYDLLVVGAGPAGCATALEAAKAGLCVLVAERKSTVGVPVRCAEYVPAPLVGELGLGRGFVVQPVKGMRTILPDGEVKETLAPGFTVRRDLLDQSMAHAAQDCGATFQLATRVVSKEGRTVKLQGRGGREMPLKAKVVVGADGPHTRVGRWVDSVNRDLIPAIQVRLPLRQPLDFTEVYFDQAFFGGYGWLFPKGEEANVGVGMRLANPRGRSLVGVLKGFIERLSREGKVAPRPLEWFAGWIPVGPPRRVTFENTMLVGDAAGHTHPITGAGVFQAIAGGRMAGRWAAEAVKKRNMDLLSQYEAEWRDLLEETLERGYRRRMELEKEWHRLPEIIKGCWVAFREYYART
jgi:digeranylgeranylglycerophospholipid reductase